LELTGFFVRASLSASLITLNFSHGGCDMRRFLECVS